MDIGKGEKREIRVFAHDTHLTLAQNFVHEHGLAPGMVRKLSNHISALVNTHAAASASPKNRSTRILDISIGIGDGRKEAIHVHAGDIHHTLACQFVNQHGLAVDMVPKLTDHITKLVLAHAREVHTAAAPILGVPPSPSTVREFDQTVDGAPPPPPAKVGAAIAAGGQHALRGSDAFDELLAKGFVVETKEEGSGKKRRPRKGDVVQVKVETYVSLVLCYVCVRACVCLCGVCVYLCGVCACSYVPPSSPYFLHAAIPPPLRSESPPRCGTPIRDCARVWHLCQQTRLWMEGFVGKVSTQQSIHGTCQARARRSLAPISAPSAAQGLRRA